MTGPEGGSEGLVVDADQHFYEVADCFSRHIERRHRDHAIVRVIDDRDIGRPVCAGQPLHFLRYWGGEPLLPPGVFQKFLQGEASRDEVMRLRLTPEDHPEFYERTARLETMDAQNVRAAILLPTLGVCVENDLHDQPEVLYANLTSYNRWIEEEWGFGVDGRIFATPVVSLIDPVRAAAEVRRLLALGARVFYLRPGPVFGHSPADPRFDVVWAQLEEAGASIAFHTGDAGGAYADLFSVAWGERAHASVVDMSTFQHFSCMHARPIMDTLAILIFQGFCQRFPSIRVLSIENGSYWLPEFLRDIDKAFLGVFGRRDASGSGQLPSEVMREKVYVAPFVEDDALLAVEALGADHVLFGSDWPHAEGEAEPADYVDRLHGLDADLQRLILHDNTAALLGLQGVGPQAGAR